MPVPPAVECPANQTLITEIMELTEDAVRNYCVMAGSAATPESFIRDWVAIELYRRYQERGLTVVLETLKSDFRKYVVEKYVEKSGLATFDKIKQFKRDAIVWVVPMPRMILEFKRHAKEKFECDAKRTAQILSVLPGLNIEGYVVAVIVDKSKPRYETYRTAVKSVSCCYGNGEVSSRCIIKVDDTAQAPDFCGVFAIKMKACSQDVKIENGR